MARPSFVTCVYCRTVIRKRKTVAALGGVKDLLSYYIEGRYGRRCIDQERCFTRRAGGYQKASSEVDTGKSSMYPGAQYDA